MVRRSPAARPCVPIPQYLDITVSNPPLGSTKYHSGQFKVDRRFSRGVGILVSYTLAKLNGDVGRNIIDFGSIGGAPQGNVMCSQNAKFDRRSCRSIEPQDCPHQFVTSTLYDLPFGKGQRFLSSGAPSAHRWWIPSERDRLASERAAAGVRGASNAAGRSAEYGRRSAAFG